MVTVDNKILLAQFSKPLLQWFSLYGRNNLPWQLPRTPYKVWISEIMLQQTQVQTVIPYFNRFMQRFPNLSDLAQANEDEVLSLWSGLGYYSRARNLHETAKRVMRDHAGIIPDNYQLLKELPGIGPSTAAAIMSQAFNQPVAILDGNVKRVLTRFFRIKGYPEQAQVKKTLWELADLCMPKEHCADYTQAIMDLGALCCTSKNPNCSNCPLQSSCLAFKYKEQHLYPTKKVKKPVPVHQQQFLVLYNEGGAIYLEKRAPTGLWGGLWCLPSLDEGDCPLDFIRLNYDLYGEAPQQLVAFKHRFSHFHLEINAWSIKTKSLGKQLAEKQGQWFTKAQISSLGLAKPTTKILSSYYNLFI
ncbi:A/G-specific adenine glycosylase [Fluoribacter dumoffii]|uniref:Adenine DNA glycosylase n=1 Tax=Fluoribacter dumoffii TaxID=463 RepID=A0A377G7K6_9GAMM|nr:A/G-specific adenine glycosylase [Fluoribacter dumoffii]KTC89690.1 A/G-specific adenine glycosylase [Fluoribacter dumoffii NY 23]MCW8384884.1 A/G-specific adenine glycosylase [Fluoribacter dumoffii]MCW8417946.1 A/G-specific adenine glycosylase [Fluoribacter dumoffii]MCW8454212.1 A/G-specific adenine glycosylase [Fluoribacter dumoffii]MCW8461714.1 A/G-specific adenine glycosylase [Fluoribacter dumoffii]